eukprot:TRINITY_DN2089_c0_g1_i5.p1 TRINITY_DN2089_c0_g1~~TRINITY_DN2089_c0_g1_i5.p1  ORF type:complete len:487 (-),score=119.33 TRINITY_DN2089_c0_g1_i5:54-1514(-)
MSRSSVAKEPRSEAAIAVDTTLREKESESAACATPREAWASQEVSADSDVKAGPQCFHIGSDSEAAENNEEEEDEFSKFDALASKAAADARSSTSSGEAGLLHKSLMEEERVREATQFRMASDDEEKAESHRSTLAYDPRDDRIDGVFDFDDLEEMEATDPETDSDTEPAPAVEALPPRPQQCTDEEPSKVVPTEGKHLAAAPSSAGSSTPLARFSTKELLQLAKTRGVDVTGCVEKSDIVDRLSHGRVHVPPIEEHTLKSHSAFEQGRSCSSHAKAEQSGRHRGLLAPAAAPSRTGAFQEASLAAATPARPLPANDSVAKAARPAAASRSQAPLAGVVSEEAAVGSWSSRLQMWFSRYPGFTAQLPPEAEMWTHQELDVYFGSNGDIWPRGKRPAWFGKPADKGDADAKSASSTVQGPKTYPDLKVHFETLDLAETTPHDIIKRHYKRLARDCHPDKHPDHVEEATKRFQEITQAYEAIASRLKL